MSHLSSWLASPPPDAAIEIAADRISAATIGVRGSSAMVQSSASEPLPPGAVVPSLTGGNITDPAAVAAAVRRTIDKLAARPSRVALVLPDTIARVSLLRFDSIPARREDLDQLVRWQLKKAAPFPVEDAIVTYSEGARTPDGGGEFVVELARRDVIGEYEAVCDQAGVHAGLIDIATLSVVNLFLGSQARPTGDWMVVHMRPEYTSLAILRDEHMIFFRSRPEGEDDSLTDLVHQTAMYYEDRLSGGGFSRVLLGGTGRTAGAVDLARRSLEERIGGVVEQAEMSPLVGVLLRAEAEAAA